MTSDFSVAAEAKEFGQTYATAGATKPKDTALGVAAAIGVGIYNNTVHAFVDDGATIDVGRAFKLESVLEYPFLLNSPIDSINPVDYLRESGPEGWAFFMDGTFGLASGLFNSWVVASADGADVSAGGSIGVTVQQ